MEETSNPPFYPRSLSLFLEMLRIKPLHMLGTCSATELLPSPSAFLFL
jgi:hypothetical protein